jgi:hypothetical protein
MVVNTLCPANSGVVVQMESCEEPHPINYAVDFLPNIDNDSHCQENTYAPINTLGISYFANDEVGFCDPNVCFSTKSYRWEVRLYNIDITIQTSICRENASRKGLLKDVDAEANNITSTEWACAYSTFLKAATSIDKPNYEPGFFPTLYYWSSEGVALREATHRSELVTRVVQVVEGRGSPFPDEQQPMYSSISLARSEARSSAEARTKLQSQIEEECKRVTKGLYHPFDSRRSPKVTARLERAADLAVRSYYRTLAARILEKARENNWPATPSECNWP